MTTITLYTGGGISLSPVYSDGRMISAYVRLVADEGKAVTDGDVTTDCIDILATDVPNWTEIDAPIADEDLPPEEALAILMGEEA